MSGRVRSRLSASIKTNRQERQVGLGKKPNLISLFFPGVLGVLAVAASQEDRMRREINLPFKAFALTLRLRFFRPQSNDRDVIMKIHEYQAKELLRRFDVKVPRGRVARSVSEAEEAAKELGLPVVVKAQIHAGGRGKGGGV